MMFGKTTQFTVPSEFLESYAQWDAYMSQLWAALIRRFSYHPEMTIIEIAPGTSTKIGGALRDLDFQGTLYIVEPMTYALSIISKQYKTWLPKANIILIQETLKESIKQLPQGTDFLLSNHPIDDMIMSFPFQTQHQHTVFDWSLQPSGHVSEAFIAHWRALSKDLAVLNLIKQQIVEEWHVVLHTLKPATTIISQYASDALEKYHLSSLSEQAFMILQALKKMTPANAALPIQDILNQFENYNCNYIGMEVLNAKNWFCLGNVDSAL